MYRMELALIIYLCDNDFHARFMQLFYCLNQCEILQLSGPQDLISAFYRIFAIEMISEKTPAAVTLAPAP